MRTLRSVSGLLGLDETEAISLGRSL